MLQQTSEPAWVNLKMLSIKSNTSWPSSSRKYSATVSPVRATLARAPGGSFIWPYTRATFKRQDVLLLANWYVYNLGKPSAQSLVTNYILTATISIFLPLMAGNYENETSLYNQLLENERNRALGTLRRSWWILKGLCTVKWVKCPTRKHNIHFWATDFSSRCNLSACFSMKLKIVLNWSVNLLTHLKQ